MKDTKNTNSSIYVNANDEEGRRVDNSNKIKTARRIKRIGFTIGMIFIALAFLCVFASSIGAVALSPLSQGIITASAFVGAIASNEASRYIQKKYIQKMNTEHRNNITNTLTKEHERAQELAHNISEKSEKAAIATVQENTPMKEQLQTAKDTLENREPKNNTITLPRQNHADMTK